MTDQTNTQVMGAEKIEAEATPAALDTEKSTAAAATTVTDPKDAELLKQLEEARAIAQQREQDIRNVKSVSDKKLYEEQRAAQQREQQLQETIHQLKLSTLDDEAKKQYLAQREEQERRELLEKATSAQRAQEEYKETLQALDFFLEKGVPKSELVLDQGYDALYESGFKWILNKFDEASKPSTPATPPLPPTAPSVVTPTGATPNVKPTWADLVKIYGDQETVYRLVEARRLDPAILPDN